jgi:hypothetical protein
MRATLAFVVLPSALAIASVAVVGQSSITKGKVRRGMRDRWDFCSRAKGLDHHQRGERCWHKCNTSPLPGGWQHRDVGKRGRLQITFADRVER